MIVALDDDEVQITIDAVQYCVDRKTACLIHALLKILQRLEEGVKCDI